VAVVTGVSRRAGIGFALARRLLADGASVLVHAWPAPEQELLDELGAIGPAVECLEADFSDPRAPGRVIERAAAELGPVDVLVANHARSSEQPLQDVTAEELDASWAVNARAVVLLVQAYAAGHDGSRPGGRVVLFTSGQHLGPMAGELPYAITKGAVHQMTGSLADALADRGVTVNALNPGPVDTGWASDELRERLEPSFPAGRWGRPEDIATIVGWLASDESAWLTGQVINAEGGFRRG
jgi:3-oxoacyl-[acyl-carrier protein] reductase